MGTYPISLKKHQLEELFFGVIGGIIDDDLHPIESIDETLKTAISNEIVDKDSLIYREYIDENGFKDEAYRLSFIDAVIEDMERDPLFMEVYDFFFSKRGSEKYGGRENFHETVLNEVKKARFLL